MEPLALFIKLQNTKKPVEKEAEKYIDEEKGVLSAEEALQGAKDILAEAVSDEADYRTFIRSLTMREGSLVSEAKDGDAESVYEMYYAYEEPLKKVAGHRVLALNRGEKEKILTVKVKAPEEEILRYLEKMTILSDNEYTTPVLKEVAQDSYHRLIEPAIEREIRNELTEKAEDGAINVFGKNLEQLLMQPPIAGKVVLGWDPAFRTGCKLAVVDETGKVLDTKVIYPTAPQNKVAESKAELKKLIRKYHISLISVGNGTVSLFSAFRTPCTLSTPGNVFRMQLHGRRQKTDRLGGNALPSSGEPKPLLCCRLHADLHQFQSQGFRNIFPHLINVGAHLRLLGDDRGIDILDQKGMLFQQFSYLFQQFYRRDAPVFFLRVRKMLPDISESCRPQQSVHDCMEQHIRVRMPEKPHLTGNLHAAYNTFSVFHQPVDIVACSYPHLLSPDSSFLSQSRFTDSRQLC